MNLVRGKDTAANVWPTTGERVNCRPVIFPKVSSGPTIDPSLGSLRQESKSIHAAIRNGHLRFGWYTR